MSAQSRLGLAIGLSLPVAIGSWLALAPGLALLGAYAGDLRAVAATTLAWVLGRRVFWIGYHRGPVLRAMARCHWRGA